jgi:hypothetical protein
VPSDIRHGPTVPLKLKLSGRALIVSPGSGATVPEWGQMAAGEAATAVGAVAAERTRPRVMSRNRGFMVSSG